VPAFGPVNLVNGKMLSAGTSPAIMTGTADGYAAKWQASPQSHVVLGTAPELISSSSATVLLLRNLWGSPVESADFGFNCNTYTRFLCHLPWSDGVIYFDPCDLAHRVTNSAQVFTAGNTDSFAFSSSTTGRGTEIWRNGGLIGTGTATTLATPSTNFYVGGVPKGISEEIDLYPSQSSLLMIAVFPRELPQDLIYQWSKDPWGVTFPPVRRPLYTGMGSGSWTPLEVDG
jgi:hypothetical protein